MYLLNMSLYAPYWPSTQIEASKFMQRCRDQLSMINKVYTIIYLKIENFVFVYVTVYCFDLVSLPLSRENF